MEGNRSDPLYVETSEPQTWKISPSGGQLKDSRGMMSSSGSGYSQCNIQNVQHDLQSSKDLKTSHKVSKDVGILSQFHRDNNSRADLLESTFPCAARSSVPAPCPHFQFDVISEDGIQLFVDLNSSPSDWIESLKDGVHICSNANKLESPNHQPEIGGQSCEQMKASSRVDSFEEVDNGDVEEGSHPVTTGAGGLPEFDELNGVEGFLSSPRCNSGNTTHLLRNLGKEQATTSSRPDSDIEKQVCGAKFRGKESDMVFTGLLASSQEIKKSSSNTIFDQDRLSVFQDFACQPKNNGTDSCGMIKSVTCTEMQAFKVADHTKSASPSDLINGHSSDPADVNQDKEEIENSKASTSGEYDREILEAQKHQASNQINGTSLSPIRNFESRDVSLMSSNETDDRFKPCSHKADQQVVEIRSSVDDIQRHEELLSSCSNSASPSFVAPQNNGNAAGYCTPPDSDDLDKDVRKSRSTSMEISGGVVAGDQINKSECMDLRDSMTDTWRKPNGSESCHDRKRKRQPNGTEGQSQFAKLDSKVSRITRQYAARIRHNRRRSSRLFTK